MYPALHVGGVYRIMRRVDARIEDLIVFAPVFDRALRNCPHKIFFDENCSVDRVLPLVIESGIIEASSLPAFNTCTMEHNFIKVGS